MELFIEGFISFLMKSLQEQAGNVYTAGGIQVLLCLEMASCLVTTYPKLGLLQCAG